eukprot:EG_transcript_13100
MPTPMGHPDFDAEAAIQALGDKLKGLVFLNPYEFYREAFQTVDGLVEQCTAKDFLIQAPPDPEQQTRVWIETITDEPLEGDLATALKSGVALCKLLNGIQPKAVTKVVTTASPFHQRENIKMFLAVASAWGVPAAELFAVDDLYEGRNMRQVYTCVLSLSNVARKVPGFRGPFIFKARATYTAADGLTPRGGADSSPSSQNTPYRVSPMRGVQQITPARHAPGVSPRLSVPDTGSGYTPWRQSSNASSTATPDGHRLSLSPEAPRPPKRESNAAAEDLPEPAAASGGLPTMLAGYQPESDDAPMVPPLPAVTPPREMRPTQIVVQASRPRAPSDTPIQDLPADQPDDTMEFAIPPSDVEPDLT